MTGYNIVYNLVLVFSMLGCVGSFASENYMASAWAFNTFLWCFCAKSLKNCLEELLENKSQDSNKQSS